MGSASHRKDDQYSNFSGGKMGDFALEVGLIVAGLGAWYLIAEPIINKIGLRPINF